MEKEKDEVIHDDKYWEEMWTRKALRGSRVSWYTWNSPVGLGLFFVEITACLWVLHLANLIR
jgi:hypothetical protein